jgi:hypothetical protein
VDDLPEGPSQNRLHFGHVHVLCSSDTAIDELLRGHSCCGVSILVHANAAWEVDRHTGTSKFVPVPRLGSIILYGTSNAASRGIRFAEKPLCLQYLDGYK